MIKDERVMGIGILIEQGRAHNNKCLLMLLRGIPLVFFGGSIQPRACRQQLCRFGLWSFHSRLGHGHVDVKSVSDLHRWHLRGHLYSMGWSVLLLGGPVMKVWGRHCGVMRTGFVPSLNPKVISMHCMAVSP